jgi:hypothetical protein
MSSVSAKPLLTAVNFDACLVLVVRGGAGGLWPTGSVAAPTELLVTGRAAIPTRRRGYHPRGVS